MSEIKNILFIPCYNCSSQINKVIFSLYDYAHIFNEIIIIDNQSTDKTVEVAREALVNSPLTHKIKLFINPYNIGLGGSHKMAFKYAVENNFDNAIVLHGDNQGDISDLLKVVRVFTARENNMFVFGARFHPHSALINYSRFRITGNVLFNFLASVIAGKRIVDLGGSGLNVFPIKLLMQQPFLQYSNDLTFHIYVLLNSLRLKQEIIYFPISWKVDGQISNVKIFSQATKVLKLLIAYFINSKKLMIDKKVNFKATTEQWRQERII